MIHSAAIIHPKAELDSTVVVGPYVVVDEHVQIGANCWIGPHVHLTGITVIGPNNRFHAGCVIGDAPQDLKYHGESTRLRIGDHNVFREHVTVHRSNKLGEDTIVGSHNFFMAGSHVGHNCVIGDNVIIANNALLAGHVQVADRAFISGNCVVHQFVRIGTLALMQGGAGISKDLPPFTIARGDNGICGLNIVGLRRAGYNSAQRLELRRLYQELFRREGKWSVALENARAHFTSEAARVMLDFLAASQRGICRDVSHPSEQTDDACQD